jgi:peptidoglycan/LPS O-acetylase OafA/YrhL
MAADIRSLTGVRGVAAVIIVVYHFGKFRLDPGSSVTVWSVPHGYLPVDLFFMLSGFVVGYVYADAFSFSRSLRVPAVFQSALARRSRIESTLASPQAWASSMKAIRRSASVA